MQYGLMTALACASLYAASVTATTLALNPDLDLEGVGRVNGGDSETLEIEFTGYFPAGSGQPPEDFTLDITFEEGCSVSF